MGDATYEIVAVLNLLSNLDTFWSNFIELLEIGMIFIEYTPKL